MHRSYLLGAALLVTRLATSATAHAAPEPASAAPLVPPPAVEAAPPPAGTAPPAAAPPPENAPPELPPTQTAIAPFAWGDFTWMNGQSRQKDFPLRAFGDAVTLSLYFDAHYAFSSNHPKDDTLTGNASVARHNELVVNNAGFGLEWNYRHLIGRVSTQFGTMLSLVQDQDGTTTRGRTLSAANLKYLREAAAGYHFDVGHGLNAEAGIFSSFVGLESYLLAENWTYTRSLITESVPFYFQGARVQYFPSDRFKIEPWLINGWQSYGKWNYAPAGGLATRWSPRESLSVFVNAYLGSDTAHVAERLRFHHDHAVVWRYHQDPNAFVSKAAVSLNDHVGFETGGDGLPGPGRANILSAYLVNRAWFAHDRLALSLRGEVFSNPSRYLAQYPPPGFATGPGTKALQLWGVSGTFDVMPNDLFALRFEAGYRRSNVPYFAGPGGTTSADGFTTSTSTTPFTADAVKDQLLAVVALNFRL